MSSPSTAPARALSRPGAAERLVEYFTLRAAAAELARLDEAARLEIADGIALARQQMAAAEALFAVGHTVEALRLGTQALRHTERAAERYAERLGVPAPGAAMAEAAPPTEAPDEAGAGAPPEVGPHPWTLLAARAGVSEARVQAASRAIAELGKRTVPALEKDISPAHVEAFRELVRARADVEEGILPATLTTEGLAGVRLFRIAGTSLLALAAAVGLYFFLRPVEGTFVRASATWADSPDFRTDFVIDGDPRTMWLTPDFEGWVEVRIVPAIPEVHRVTLVNAGTAAVPDRGTNEYQLEIYAGGRLERTVDGAFGEDFGATATHEVNVRNVERIRFVARSGYRRGSGLAELSWE